MSEPYTNVLYYGDNLECHRIAREEQLTDIEIVQRIVLDGDPWAIEAILVMLHARQEPPDGR